MSDVITADDKPPNYNARLGIEFRRHSRLRASELFESGEVKKAKLLAFAGSAFGGGIYLGGLSEKDIPEHALRLSKDRQYRIENGGDEFLREEFTNLLIKSVPLARLKP